jgi:hypothetical protein
MHAPSFTGVVIIIAMFSKAFSFMQILNKIKRMFYQFMLYLFKVGIFVFTTASRTALGPTQPPIQWVPAVLSLGVQRLGREAEHSPPSSAEVKNVWSYTSTPQYVFTAWCLVKHRDFTFYLYFLTGK